MAFPSRDEAVEFFSQLGTFSTRIVMSTLDGVPDASLNRAVWKRNKPIGAILHYTAGASWRSAVKWFNAFRESSAHVVVCDRIEKEAADFADDLPLVKALPVTVVQCVPPTSAAWHARWVNPLCYGIENRNVGRVHRDNVNDVWRYWANEGRGRAPQVPGKNYQPVSDLVGYEPYTRAQLATNVILLRYLQAFFDTPLEPHFVLPHSAVQGNKFDTGPLFPIHEIRRLSLFDTAIDPLEALVSYTDPEDLTSFDDLDEIPLENFTTLTDGTLIVKAMQALGAVKHDGVVDAFAAPVRAQLDRLGFFVPRPVDPRKLDTWLKRALWIYQTGSGVVPVTNKPDSTTRASLIERLKAVSA